MYTLKTKSSFDSAHFLAGYEGKCKNIHGHRWTVEIEVGDKHLIQEGTTREMVVDFWRFEKGFAQQNRRTGPLFDYGKGDTERNDTGSASIGKFQNSPV